MDQPLSDLDFNIKISEDSQTGKESLNSESTSVSDSKKQEKQQQQKVNDDKPGLFDIKRAAHPKSCFFTVLFKGLSIVFYLLFNLFVNSSVLSFIVVLLCACADFWTVKNVTGRFLVGMRWWTEFKEDGTEVWMYESADPTFEPNGVDYTFFWYGQFLATAFFGVMFVINLITFSLFWALLNFICFSLYSANFGGFYKCKGQHQKKMKQAIANVGFRVVSNSI